MEFERALFRVHHRVMGSVQLRKFRLSAERAVPPVFFVSALLVWMLHARFVGQSHCTVKVASAVGLWNETLARVNMALDEVLLVSVVDVPAYADDLSGVELGEDGASSMPGAARDHSGEGSSVSHASASGKDWVLARYKFARSHEVFSLRLPLREEHGFQVRRLDIPMQCLVPVSPVRHILAAVGGMDTVIVNEIAYALQVGGVLARLDAYAAVETETPKETWSWSDEQLRATLPGQSVGRVFCRKVLLLLGAIASSSLLSAITGVFVRVGVSGSAVLMFPLGEHIVRCAQRLGIRMPSLEYLIRSYPWVGVHVDLLHRAGHSPAPVLHARLVFLFVEYFSYRASALAWRLAVFRRLAPAGFEERLFALCTALEFFSLLFVRSERSVRVFPKLVSGALIYLHFYVLCLLFPFHGLALWTCALACVYVAVYCLNHFEEPAMRADPMLPSTPTHAHPRSCYVPRLSPSWAVEVAPLWTSFYPPEFARTFPVEMMRPVVDEELEELGLDDEDL